MDYKTNSKKTKSIYRVPIRVKIEYFLIKKKWLRVVFTVLLWSGIMMLFIFIAIKLFSPYLNDLNTATLFGALFGALLTAIVGGFFASTILLNQLESTAYISKKKNIYEPLYDDIIQYKEHFSNYPYPEKISMEYKDSVKVSFSYPVFREWGKIKNEARFIQVPSWIVKVFGIRSVRSKSVQTSVKESDY